MMSSEDKNYIGILGELLQQTLKYTGSQLSQIYTEVQDEAPNNVYRVRFAYETEQIDAIGRSTDREKKKEAKKRAAKNALVQVVAYLRLTNPILEPEDYQLSHHDLESLKKDRMIDNVQDRPVDQKSKPIVSNDFCNDSIDTNKNLNSLSKINDSIKNGSSSTNYKSFNLFSKPPSDSNNFMRRTVKCTVLDANLSNNSKDTQQSKLLKLDSFRTKMHSNDESDMSDESNEIINPVEQDDLCNSITNHSEKDSSELVSFLDYLKQNTKVLKNFYENSSRNSDHLKQLDNLCRLLPKFSNEIITKSDNSSDYSVVAKVSVSYNKELFCTMLARGHDSLLTLHKAAKLLLDTLENQFASLCD